MRSFRVLLVAAGLGLGLLFGGSSGLACDMVCVADENYEAMLRHYSHVLVGRIDSRSETAWGPEFRLSSIRVWKGGKKSIVLRNTSGMCGKNPAIGRVYLVFAATDPQDVTMCSPVMGVWEEPCEGRHYPSRPIPPLSTALSAA